MDTNLTILGAGPGGYVAAIKAASLQTLAISAPENPGVIDSQRCKNQCA